MVSVVGNLPTRVTLESYAVLTTVGVPTILPAKPAEVGDGNSAGSEQLLVSGLSARQIGLTAAERGIALFELTERGVSLEEAFMELTRDAVEYHATALPVGSAA